MTFPLPPDLISRSSFVFSSISFYSIKQLIVLNIYKTAPIKFSPKIINTETAQIDPNYYILASPKGSKSASWYQLDISAINTWRPISIADQNLENRSLKIVETDNVVFTWDATEFNKGEAATFGIELQWKEWTE